ncbi:hypothetical protein KK092_07355 [Curtobacterium flaccumfaciens pv. flaccumfaciens]|uniref:hypothetical protein n=2 Tax=Curtobacterium TaxID=2034 RepID=UPI001BDF5F4D|nr:hypothetical protein [Curtobacterium flaccumfaciens]MBT1669194.1 hypothetical protein [Curtobacterium flaccumfaciens pv. flaccumfaciens]
MPQLIEVKFSGLTIKDRKIPYIFLSRGNHGDDEEPEGRQLFTLTLLTVLVARGIFAPVTYDGRNLASNPGREYDIVSEILMPVAQMRTVSSDDLGEIRSTADSFRVTPSAMVVRLQRLGLISRSGAQQHLEELRLEFANRPKSQGRQPRPVNGVRTYNGRELSVRMLGALDAGKITEGEFCRAVCANKDPAARDPGLPGGARMMGTFYLLDNNVLTRLTQEQRSSAFVHEQCRLPSEVLHEARFLPDVDSLRPLEYTTNEGVLLHLAAVLQRVPADDTTLIDLYANLGNADPLLLACALDALAEAELGLFGAEWVVVSNDRAVVALAGDLGVPTLSSEAFSLVLGEDR